MDKKLYSGHIVAFEEKYGTKITNDSFISKNFLKKKGIHLILSKAKCSYYKKKSSPRARARLASVLLGGKARQVDKAIWEKYKV